MSGETGRDELARRLGRIFVSNTDTGQPVTIEKLREFADDILAPDYTDPAWGPRPGDGGPAMALTVSRPSEGEAALRNAEWLDEAAVNADAQGHESVFLRPNDARAIAAMLRAALATPVPADDRP